MYRCCSLAVVLKNTNWHRIKAAGILTKMRRKIMLCCSLCCYSFKWILCSHFKIKGCLTSVCARQLWLVKCSNVDEGFMAESCLPFDGFQIIPFLFDYKTFRTCSMMLGKMQLHVPIRTFIKSTWVFIGHSINTWYITTCLTYNCWSDIWFGTSWVFSWNSIRCQGGCTCFLILVVSWDYMTS